MDAQRAGAHLRRLFRRRGQHWHMHRVAGDVEIAATIEALAVVVFVVELLRRFQCSNVTSAANPNIMIQYG